MSMLFIEITLRKYLQGMLGIKGVQWGPSNLRPEATGYGVVFYAKEVLADLYKDLKGLRCVVSGAGKVAMYVLEKLIAFGAVPVTISGKVNALKAFSPFV
jgi:glutamate dehydrogenase (NADP+)